MYAMDHQDQVKDNHTQNQPSNKENTNPNSSSNAANGALYAKVMTDEQLETLRKQIAVYACICETLCDMHKNLTAHQDLAGVRMGNLYCEPLMTSTAHKITARLRWTPTPVQLRILERIFNQGNGIPSKQKIKEITTELRQHGRIAEINVYNWFQNRHARSKRKLQNEAMNNAESKVETEVYSPKEMKTQPEIFLSQKNSVPRSEDLCFQSPAISSELHFADSHTKVEGIFPSDSDLRWRNLGQMSFFDGILSSAHGVRMGNLYCEPLMRSTAHKITARLRWTPTPVQLRILESIFNQGYGIPSKRKIKEITTELRQHGRISEINVYNWFQNQWARSKRKLQNEAMNNAESKVETEVYSPKEMKTKPEIFLSQQNSVPRSEDLCFQSPEISSELHFADSHTKVEGIFPSDSDLRWRNLGQMSFFNGILSSAHADTMEEMSTSRRMGKSPVNSDGMQESSYSGNSSNCSGLGNICFCGFTCPVQISRNKKNLGRRFLSCLGRRGEAHCSFFKWVDLAMPDCAKEVIIELRDQLDQSTPSNAHVSINIDEVATAEGALATWLKVVKDKLACLRKNVKSDRKQMMLLSYSLVTSWVLFFLVALGVVVIMMDSKREKFVSSRLDHSH